MDEGRSKKKTKEEVYQDLEIGVPKAKMHIIKGDITIAESEL